MAQLFKPSINTIVRAGIVGGAVLAGLAVWGWAAFVRADYVMRVHYPVEQPVPFSHKHHVGELGLDCRYCHTSVEKSAFAGMPPTKTCMTCHSQLYTNAQMLAPVRQSLAENKPIQWNRVYDLPDFVYFNHSVHVHKGIGCTTCHGQIGEMPLTRLAQPLWMRWCLNCHRDPAKFVRPRSEVFNPDYKPPNDQERLGRELVKKYRIVSRTDCSTCHR